MEEAHEVVSIRRYRASTSPMTYCGASFPLKLAFMEEDKKLIPQRNLKKLPV